MPGGLLTALVILAIITVSVVVHELAHYLNARSVGVPVRAFSVGFGPILWRKRWRGTEWRISALPLGGYVDLPGLAAEVGEDGELRHSTEGLAQKNVWQKLWVLIGGVIANFLLAVVLMAVAISAEPNYRALTAPAQLEGQGAVFVEVVPGSVAERLGIEPGDAVLELNAIARPTPQEVTQTIRSADELRLVLERHGEVVTLTTPWPLPEAGDPPMLGVGVGARLPEIGFPQALAESAGFFVRVVPETVGGFVRGVSQTVSGQRSEEIAGPVGIVMIANEVTRLGLIPILFFAAIINFSLAIFNLLPIPALDGGRMLLTVIVALRGKPFRPGQEEFIHFLGFVALIGFMLLITLSELGDLFGGG
jgi:regulator of sigma E protease